MICGPTAAGKTRAALWFASHVDLSVVSADSRQVYRGFDIGTAKPTSTERQTVPHVGIDVLDPTERASAAAWAEQADAWIDAITAAGRVPVVVGGTGLYLRALCGDLFGEPALDEPHRDRIRSVIDTVTTEELRRWVRALDPARSHLGRTQLLRAVEVALLSGRRISELHRDNARPPRRRARYLVVDPGPVLADRIAERTRSMIRDGWRDEVRRLMREVPDSAPAWNATGYRAIRDVEQGTLSPDEAREHVIISTRQYAKRQRTWFRHQLGGQQVTRLSMEQPDWAERALSWWNEGGTEG